MAPFKLPLAADGIPALGFGSGTSYYNPAGTTRVNPVLVDTLVKAVHQGFFHIDTAVLYNVAPEIAAGLKVLKDEGVSRSDLFVTTKWNSSSPHYPTQSHTTPYLELKETLAQLGTDYVDLYLVHTPFVTNERFGFSLEEAWTSMEQCLKEGLAKKIGVSNFAVADIKRILKVAKHRPEVNQIEFHVLLQNQTPGIVDFCKSQGIALEAFSPLGSVYRKTPPKDLDDALTRLETKYGKTRTQILLRWVIQYGVIPISTTAKASRLEEWKGVFNFELEQADEDEISRIGKSHTPQTRLYWNPEYDQYN